MTTCSKQIQIKRLFKFSQANRHGFEADEISLNQD